MIPRGPSLSWLEVRASSQCLRFSRRFKDKAEEGSFTAAKQTNSSPRKLLTWRRSRPPSALKPRPKPLSGLLKDVLEANGLADHPCGICYGPGAVRGIRPWII